MNYYNIPQPTRLITLEVKIGDLIIGGNNPIRVQTMTTTDTMDTLATVEQSIRCIEAGAELVRITAPSKKEAENLQNIKDEDIRANRIISLYTNLSHNDVAVSYNYLSRFLKAVE